MEENNNFLYKGYLLVIEPYNWYWHGKCKELDYNCYEYAIPVLKSSFLKFVDEKLERVTEIFEYKGYVLVIEEHGWFYDGVCKELNFGDTSSDTDYLKKDFKELVDKIIKEKEQIQYGQKMLAQDLFNSMLRYYPEALPEVIEVLDKLHNRYRGRVK